MFAFVKYMLLVFLQYEVIFWIFLSIWSMPLDDDITTGLSFIFEFTNSLISDAEYRLLIGVPFIILLIGNCRYPVPPIDCLSFFYNV